MSELKSRARSWYRLKPARDDAPTGLLAPVGASESLLSVQVPLTERLGELLLDRRDVWEEFLGPQARRFDHGPPPTPTTVYAVLASAAEKDAAGWATVEVRLRSDPDYAAARDELDEVEEQVAEARRLVGAAANAQSETWPDSYALRQGDGRRRWGVLIEPSQGLQLVGDDFLGALADAGLTRGWTSLPGTFFDRAGRRVNTHRVLSVSGRVARRGFEARLDERASAPSDQITDLARELPTGRTDVVGPWLFGTADVRAALLGAGTTDIEFEPVRGAMYVVDTGDGTSTTTGSE